MGLYLPLPFSSRPQVTFCVDFNAEWFKRRIFAAASANCGGFRDVINFYIFGITSNDRILYLQQYSLQQKRCQKYKPRRA